MYYSCWKEEAVVTIFIQWDAQSYRIIVKEAKEYLHPPQIALFSWRRGKTLVSAKNSSLFYLKCDYFYLKNQSEQRDDNK